MGKAWRGAEGLAEDVRYYGRWMRDEAEKRIGNLYPKVRVTAEMAKDRPDLRPYVEHELTVIAWLWARTVKSPNPAFAAIDVPLVSTFVLSRKEGQGRHMLNPSIEGPAIASRSKFGNPSTKRTNAGTKIARGANFRCLMSGIPISSNYIKAEGRAGRMGVRLMAIVGEGNRGRVYLSPTSEHELVAHAAEPTWYPEAADRSRSTFYVYALVWLDTLQGSLYRPPIGRAHSLL